MFLTKEQVKNTAGERRIQKYRIMLKDGRKEQNKILNKMTIKNTVNEREIYNT